MLHGMIRNDHYVGMNLNKMIFVSGLLHVIALLILIFAPSIPSPRWTFGPIYSVQLVSMSDAVLEKGPQSSLSREFMEAAGGKQIVVAKKKTEAVESIPIKRIDVQKAQDRENIIENLRKKSQSASQTEEQRAVSASAASRGETVPGTASGRVDRSINLYYAQIWSRIKSQWVFPQSISPKENFNAVVNVTILRNGTITELRFEKRSGNRYFDDSVMRAIRKASPFPPLPSDLGEQSIELGIRFHSQDLR
jgi:colicin import membrane protein